MSVRMYIEKFLGYWFEINQCKKALSQVFEIVDIIKIIPTGFWEFWTNPFVPNAPFLYPMKTSENGKVFLGGRERMHWERMS